MFFQKENCTNKKLSLLKKCLCWSAIPGVLCVIFIYICFAKENPSNWKEATLYSYSYYVTIQKVLKRMLWLLPIEMEKYSAMTNGIMFHNRCFIITWEIPASCLFYTVHIEALILLNL